MLNQIEERNTALRENSERLTLALEASRTGTWDWSIPNDRLTWDRYLDSLLGGAKGSEGRTFAEFLRLIQPEDQARFQQLAINSMSEGREFLADFRITWPNGELHHLSTRGRGFRDASGKPVRMTGVMIDITDSERAEQALRDSEQRYRSLVSAITSVVWISDPAGAFKVPQLSWQAFTGQSFEEHRGFGWMQALHPDDRDRIRAAWAKAQSTLTRYEAEGRLWNASLKVYRHFITRAVPILEGSGRVREWVGTVTDVHDRKLAEEEIQRLNSELEQRVLARTAELATTNQELESFTYSVSHDLRSPLRHIDAYAQILQEEFGGEMPEEATKYLTRIRNGTQNMGHLVDDLLNLARVGRQELNFKPASLRALVDEVIEEMADETKASTVEWTIGDLPTIPCDPGLIKQVFANLLSNAVKYSRPRPIARIEIGLTEARDQTAIFVRDNGVGFNMKYVSKLFGVFQRLHRAEEFEGTGVGLATVQRIVRKHGGEIWVESEVEKGATFYFTLKSLQTLGA
jgi:PAS domain S-box-containing protein